MRNSLTFPGMVAALCFIGSAAGAAPVGERHLIATDSTAALRDAQHGSQVRVTVWYPAVDGAKEERIDLGPSGKPLFIVDAVAQGAAFADTKQHPVILLSHGFGGTARMMGWFGVPLARAGYVVVAVDHPGNNGVDKMTAAGATLFWDRAEDLHAALDKVIADPLVGPHVDPHRVGVSGFSAGGYTALVAAGARGNVARLMEFCRANPQDGICLPQKEFPLTVKQSVDTMNSPELASEVAHAGDDHSIADLRAVFAIAPAIIQELTPESLAGIKAPVAIILGSADPVAPPATNGLVAAKIIPDVELKVLPGVGHYDFLSTCTPAGKAVVPICADTVPQGPTHDAAIEMATTFFKRTLGSP